MSKKNKLDIEIDRYSFPITASVVKFTGNGRKLEVPEEVEGFPVTKIAENAFENCKTLEKITLPDTIEIIDEFAFSNCARLTEIIIPPKVKVLECGAFRFCSSLNTVVLSENLEKISENVFFKCIQLSNVRFNKKLKVIDMRAFTFCKNLNNLFLPSSLKLIAKYSFLNCDNLRNICFVDENGEIVDNPDDILVENNAIAYNKAMFCIPECVVNSFNDEFKESYLLKLISLYNDLTPPEKEVLTNGWNNNDEFYMDLVFFKSDAETVSMYFKEGFSVDLAHLDEYLQHNINKENTEINAILLEYKNNNFTKEEIEKHENEKDLLEYGFKLPTLQQLSKKWEIREHKDHITISGYKGNSKFEVIPEAIDSGKPILYVAYSILLAFVESNVGIMGSNRMLYSSRSFDIPEEFLPLERVALSNGDEILLTGDLKKSKMKEIDFPPDLTMISEGFLNKFEHLEKVNLPDSLETIDGDGISCLPLLKEIELPTNIKHIGKAAFFECIALEKIVLPSSIKTMHSCVFQGCCNLVDVTLPNSIEYIYNYMFKDCKNLKSIILPESVKEIRESAFDGCVALTTVTIPESVTFIHEDAFDSCPNLDQATRDRLKGFVNKE